MTTHDGDTIAATAQGLRDLADFVEQHPDLPWRHGSTTIALPVGHGDDTPAEAMANVARTGGTWTKSVDAAWFNLTRTFGLIKVEAFVARNEVCERVVVGTRQVEKVVPTAHRTELVEEEIVEWQCHPILADAIVDDEKAVA